MRTKGAKNKHSKLTHREAVMQASQAVKETEFVSVIAEALQANTDRQDEDSTVVLPSDFEADKEPVLQPQEEPQPLNYPVGDSERQRMLKSIREGINPTDTSKDYNAERKEVTEKRDEMQTDIAEKVNAIKAKLAAQQPKAEFPKMTIEHYKTLKAHERFWIPFRDHGALYGLNHRELSALGKVMHEAFNPGYGFNFHCPSCIGEFLTDLYNDFEKWKKNSQEEVSEYETITKADKF